MPEFIVLTAVFGFGVAIGYGWRARISYRRRQLAKGAGW